MANATLVLHRGSREVSREELDTVPVPPATSTWFPVRHGLVLHTALDTLQKAGFAVERTRLALSRGDARFFGTLDLATPLADGVTLAVGIRNSIDKSLPIAFCAGSRVFCCDNLAFRSEIVVARKHTRNGQARFNEAICRAVQSLHPYREAEAARICHFQHTELSADAADALLLRAYEQEILTAPLLPRVLREWREPSFEEFRPRTLWSLFNAFTTVLTERQRTNPQQFAAMTIRLHDFLGGARTDEESVPAAAA
jgi:hypothetical protein